MVARSKQEEHVKVGTFSLAMIGIGSFLGGDFIGWPSVLVGGFGSAICSLAFFGVFFWMLGATTSELVARYRESGGTYMFSRRVFGDHVGHVAGVLHTIKLVASNCCMALAISGYLQHVTFYSHVIQIATWVTCFVFFTVIHIIGGKSSIHFQSAIVMLCLGVLMIYFVAATMNFDFHGRSIGERGWFVNGFYGFISGFPFGIWFMDGFEELPLAVAYAEDAARSVPRAMNISFVMALVLAGCLLVLGSGSTDPQILMDATAPLMVTFTNVWGQNHFLIYALDATIILGLAVSFSSFVLLSGNMIQVMAMEGDMLPVVLSRLHPTYHTPAYAIVFASLLGFGITAIFGIMFGEDLAEDALITCSLLAAVSCYIFNFSCLYRVYTVEEEQKRIKSSSSNSNGVASASSAESDPSVSICGYDPENLRFVMGKTGTVLGLVMCGLVLMCIIYLFVKVEDYHFGILIIAGTTCVCLLVTAIYGYIHKHCCGGAASASSSSSSNSKGSSSSNSSSAGSSRELEMSDSLPDDSIRSTAPLTQSRV